MRRRLLYTITALAISTSSVLSAGLPLYGLTFSERGFAEQGIFYYSPEGYDVCTGSDSRGIIGGETLPSQTTTYLESINLKSKAETNKPSYVEAERQTGVPWQALAALHYRKAQLDPAISTVTGTALGSSANSEGLTPGTDFIGDLVLAANQLIDLSSTVYGVPFEKLPLSTAQWGEAFLAYDAVLLYKNSGKDFSLSPFVVNGIDETHQGMSWADVDILTGVDSLRVGALVIFQYLGGVYSNSSSLACGGVYSGNIIGTAKHLAHAFAIANGKKEVSDATPQYQTVWRDNGKATISDCGGFVSIVMRTSGVDQSFPVSGTDAILTYFKANSKYTEVDYNSLLPGDILLSDNGGSRTGGSYSGHIMIYLGSTVGSDGAQYVAVDASLDQRVPSLRPNSSVVWMQERANSSAWRLVGE